MNKKIASPTPEPIVQLQRRLDEFRSSRSHRTKLPESVWQSAVELAREYGLYSVTRPLRLDYTQLKKRVEGAVDIPKQAAAPAFVELIGSHPAAVSEYLIEFESSIGGKMRIQWKGSGAPDWISLLRGWRESER